MAAVKGISHKEAIVLRILLVSTVSREMTRLQIVGAADGAITKESIYATVERMDRKGLLISRQEWQPEGSTLPRHRWYSASPKGERAMLAWLLAQSPPYPPRQ